MYVCVKYMYVCACSLTCGVGSDRCLDLDLYGVLCWCSMQAVKPEYRKISVPPHRFSPLKKQWMDLYQPLVDKLKLEVRMNLKNKWVEIRVRGEGLPALCVVWGAPVTCFVWC